MVRKRNLPPAVLALGTTVLVALPLAGCGGSSGSSKGSSSASASTSSVSSAKGAIGSAPGKVPSSLGAPEGASAKGSTARVDAVAFVAGTPIAKSSYEHWLVVEKAGGVAGSPSHRALGFLITSDWVLDEAAARHISVSEAQVKRRFGKLIKQSFSKPSSLRSFLAKAQETEADLLGRVKGELLQSGVAAQVSAGKSSSQRKTLLASFQKTFQHHWKALTRCDAGYVMEDCSEYKGGPENLAVTNSSSNPSKSSSSGSTKASSKSSSGSSSGESNVSSASNATGEVYPSSNSLSLTSSAFERNGEIPTQYTCDGAGISPPLQWSNLPAKAAALMLFIIDDSSTGPASGIRWVVGDINPSSKGVAAGATPEGGIVGSDSQGHAGYGGICPQPGKTSTIEFVMYALSKPIPLTPGFQPDIAESEYGGSHKLLLGSAGVTYAVYTRPS